MVNVSILLLPVVDEWMSEARCVVMWKMDTSASAMQCMLWMFDVCVSTAMESAGGAGG